MSGLRRWLWLLALLAPLHAQQLRIDEQLDALQHGALAARRRACLELLQLDALAVARPALLAALDDAELAVRATAAAVLAYEGTLDEKGSLRLLEGLGAGVLEAQFSFASGRDHWVSIELDLTVCGTPGDADLPTRFRGSLGFDIEPPVPVVEHLVALSIDSPWHVQARQILRFFRWGGACVPALCAISASDASAEIRLEALLLLREGAYLLGNEVCATLVELLREDRLPGSAHRVAAVEALLAGGGAPLADEWLIAALQAADPALSAACAFALARSRPSPPEGLPEPISRVLQPRIPKAPGSPASQMGAQALAGLRPLLAAQQPEVRLAAAWALWEIGRDASGVTQLTELLVADDPAHRLQALWAVAALGPAAEACLPVLELFLDYDAGFAATLLAERRGLLEPFRRLEAEALLARLAESLPGERDAPLKRLRELGWPVAPLLASERAEADPELRFWLDGLAAQVFLGNDDGLSRAAQVALASVGAQRTRSHALVREGLSSISADVRNAAAWALGEMGWASDRQALYQAAQNDPDPEVRRSAERALVLLDGRSEPGQR